MAIDINGYNETFRNFADFAKTMVEVNRNFMSGKFKLTLIEPHMSFALDVSPDGNTAVVTLKLDLGLLQGDNKNNFFGKAVIHQRITVDLTPDMPVVTNVNFAQELI